MDWKNKDSQDTSIIQSIDLRILRVAVIVVEMENKGTSNI